MNRMRTLVLTAIGVLATTLGALDAQAANAPAATASTAKPTPTKNILLIHGAWADGSSWEGVIPKPQAAGMHVTAVQNPLTSLEDSVAATRRALALQDGPTVLVAHSWGGTVHGGGLAHICPWCRTPGNSRLACS